MSTFKNLDIWNVGFCLCRKIYKITTGFPNEELYGLTSQLRRASVSIPSNIAEGSGRSSPKDFRKFLYNALGSLREVETQILIGRSLAYLSEGDFEGTYKKIDELGAKLTNFIRKISERC